MSRIVKVPKKAPLEVQGKALTDQLRMNEEDVLGGLGMEPARAGNAMLSLFDEAVSWIEEPGYPEDDMTPRMRAEHAEETAKFWNACDALSFRIMSCPDRPDFDLPGEAS